MSKKVPQPDFCLDETPKISQNCFWNGSFVAAKRVHGLTMTNTLSVPAERGSFPTPTSFPHLSIPQRSSKAGQPASVLLCLSVRMLACEACEPETSRLLQTMSVIPSERSPVMWPFSISLQSLLFLSPNLFKGPRLRAVGPPST